MLRVVCSPTFALLCAGASVLVRSLNARNDAKEAESRIVKEYDDAQAHIEEMQRLEATGMEVSNDYMLRLLLEQQERGEVVGRLLREEKQRLERSILINF